VYLCVVELILWRGPNVSRVKCATNHADEGFEIVFRVIFALRFVSSLHDDLQIGLSLDVVVAKQSWFNFHIIFFAFRSSYSCISIEYLPSMRCTGVIVFVSGSS